MHIGVVGCGYWGSKHVRVLHQMPEVESVVAVDPRPERRAALAHTCGDIVPFARLSSALPHVEALVIAAPPSSHERLALQSLDAGKHVLVEKPMTTSPAGARRLIDAAAERGLILMAGHTFEYNAAVWKLRDLIASGDLGEIYYIDTARLNLGSYQSDINVVWDLAPHDFSIINYLLQSPPTTVETWAARHAQLFQEDVAYIRLDYPESGVQAQVHVSWLDPCKVRRVTVAGSRKMAVYNDLADDERVRIYDKGVVPAERDRDDVQNVPVSYRVGGISSPFIAMREPLAVQDQHFVECVATGRQPRTDGANGLCVVEMLEASAQSLRQGTPVAVPGSAQPARNLIREGA